MPSAVQRSGRWRIKPSAKLPIFLRYIINSSFDHKVANKLGFKNHIVNRVYLNHMMYWPASEYDAFEGEVIYKAKNKRGWFEAYYQRELRKSTVLYNLGLRLQKTDWSKKSNQQIKKILDDLLAKYRELACAWYAQYPLDEHFETSIERKLAQYFPSSHPDFRKFVLIFTDPKEMTDVAEERWRLMKLARKFKKNKERLLRLSKRARVDINQHLAKFAYINRGLATSKPYTFQDMVERVKEAWQGEQSLEELIYFSSEHKIEDDYKWALKQIKLKADLSKLIRQARLHSYLRNRRVEAFFLADYGASFMYNEIARRAKFNPDWIMEITMPEMYGALKGKSLPAKREMQRRFKNYAMVVREAKTKFIVNRKEIKKLEKKYFVVSKKTKELKGRMACLGGVITGRAKVCLDKNQINKVKKGDILITQFTTPDFVPAMERAAAIVADQGGLSSHAAIVSRELGVPCVIDTKNATRLIKDNDLIEIDARQGIIKILS
ncbi:MAG: PEP-utilizing enzyme [Candidatus Jacksonbacteria bacterium]